MKNEFEFIFWGSIVSLLLAMIVVGILNYINNEKDIDLCTNLGGYPISVRHEVICLKGDAIIKGFTDD